MRWLAFAAWLAVVTFVVVPSVSAHGDVRGLDETVPLSTGESYDVLRAVHYHRLVGSVEATGVSMPLVVKVTGPDGAARTVAGPDDSLRVNHLIACCKGEVWTDHTITVQNQGSQEAFVRIDLSLLHDDFAVVAEDAEPGAQWQTLLSAVVLAAVPAWSARRPATPDREAAARWFRIGAWSLASAWAVVVLMSLVGMVRFGGGLLQGSLTALQPVPVTGGFVNSHLLVAVPLAAAWVVALAGWAVASRRSVAVGARPARWLAYAAAAGPVVFGLLFAVEYGNPLLAAFLGLLPAAAILAAEHLPRAAIPKPLPPS